MTPQYYEKRVGAYVATVDKNHNPNTPGDYPVATTGVIVLEGIGVAFTLLGQAKNDVAVREVLQALQSATFSALPKTETLSFQGISLDLPPFILVKTPAQKSDSYVHATSGRTNLSITVTDRRGKRRGHAAAADAYWSTKAQLPGVDAKSIRRTNAPRYVRVSYDFDVKYGDRHVKQRNVHYYFEKRGHWVDVHLSVIDPSSDDESVFKTVEESLRYQ